MLLTSECLAQNRYTLSGTLKDADSGEVLIGATVYITFIQKGTTSNTYGFYSITLPEKDSMGVVFSYLG